MSRSAAIVGATLISPYGIGLGPCWQGLLAGRSAIGRHPQFCSRHWQSDCSALVPDGCLAGHQRSRLTAMLGRLFALRPSPLPAEAALLLATTVGEVDRLEADVTASGGDLRAGNPLRLLSWLREQTGIRGPGALVSAACASSAVALARGQTMIEEGKSETVLVVGCDGVSEFIFAGFSALMALSPQPARPYDQGRDGLTLGEAAVAVVLMDEERARREQHSILATVAGCGIASDANHMTGPCRRGDGLAKAMVRALQEAEVDPADIAFVCGHGTGTVYNDAMELQAFKQVFGSLPPLFSVKGGTGHTLGAAGLLEAVVTARALRQQTVPVSVGTVQPMAEAEGKVCLRPLGLTDARFALSTNSGFGGVNSALVISLPDRPHGVQP